MSTPEEMMMGGGEAPSEEESAPSPTDIVPRHPLDDFFRRKHQHDVMDSIMEKEFTARCAIVRVYHTSYSTLVDHFLSYLGGLHEPTSAHIAAYQSRHFEHESRMVSSPSLSPRTPRRGGGGGRAASPTCTARSDNLATSFVEVETPFDLSLALHRKDVRVRAMELTYDDEYKRTEQFREREQRRTAAAWKRAEGLQKKALSRKSESLKHSSYVDRQRQKEANEKRQVYRESDEAAKTRQELIATQKRSHQLAKYQSDRMAREAIQAAADGLSQAKGVLDKEVLYTMQVEASRKEHGVTAFESSTRHALYKRTMYEEAFTRTNCNGAERMDREQLSSFGAEDRSRVMRPEGLKSTIQLPVRELTSVPTYRDPTGRHPIHGHHSARGHTARQSNTTSGPMDSRLYDRLCNVSSPLSAPAIRDRVWGSGASPSDLSSYYMVRAPPTVVWKR